MAGGEIRRGAMWRPIRLTDKATGRFVMITIFDRELYCDGFLTFEDLWESYQDEAYESKV